ncbi:hypothetical protein O3P69_015533 [Scylla paramamosain]|uniref:Uncharacterized protein n=1 Tax=Scylla paramamosain TaxID=85552 RepID=A0AAW0SGV2_SCYPA
MRKEKEIKVEQTLLDKLLSGDKAVAVNEGVKKRREIGGSSGPVGALALTKGHNGKNIITTLVEKTMAAALKKVDQPQTERREQEVRRGHRGVSCESFGPFINGHHEANVYYFPLTSSKALTIYSSQGQRFWQDVIVGITDASSQDVYVSVTRNADVLNLKIMSSSKKEMSSLRSIKTTMGRDNMKLFPLVGLRVVSASDTVNQHRKNRRVVVHRLQEIEYFFFDSETPRSVIDCYNARTNRTLMQLFVCTQRLVLHYCMTSMCIKTPSMSAMKAYRDGPSSADHIKFHPAFVNSPLKPETIEILFFDVGAHSFITKVFQFYAHFLFLVYEQSHVPLFVRVPAFCVSRIQHLD